MADKEAEAQSELLYVVTASKLNFVESVAYAMFFAGACTFVLGPMLDKLPFIDEVIKFKIRMGAGFVFLCVFMAILSPFLSYGICQKLYVYSDKLLYKAGFFSRGTQTLPLTRVTGVETTESLWQRAIGTGDIIIMSGSLPRIVFRGARVPEKTAEYLQKVAKIF